MNHLGDYNADIKQGVHANIIILKSIAISLHC